MEMLSCLIFFILVIYVAFSNHEQLFFKSKQFKLMFLIILITTCCYSKCLALILLLAFIIMDNNFSNEFDYDNLSSGLDYHNLIEGLDNKAKEEDNKEHIYAGKEVGELYKNMFCKDDGKGAIDKIASSTNKTNLDEVFKNVFFSSGIKPSGKIPLKHHCETDDIKIYGPPSYLNQLRDFLGLESMPVKKPPGPVKKPPGPVKKPPGPCVVEKRFLVGDNSNKQLGYVKGAPIKSLVHECVDGLTVTSNNSKVSQSQANNLIKGYVTCDSGTIGNQEVTFTFTFPKPVTLDGFTFATYMYGRSTGYAKNWQLLDENNKTIINGGSISTGGSWSILKRASKDGKIEQSKPKKVQNIDNASDIINFNEHTSKVWHFKIHVTKQIYIYLVRFHGNVAEEDS